MANYTNHVVDPTFFYDAIEQFAFDYDIYVVESEDIDDDGNQVHTYSKKTIRGSLQTQGLNRRQSKRGNTDEIRYDFYCKSLYRIDVGDFINYKNLWLYCESVHEYDEYGVRSCSLISVKLTAYKDLKEYVKYINGENLV